MNVAITGDRAWSPDDTYRILRALATLDPTSDHVILGDAAGIDTIAQNTCEQLHLSYTRFAAHWKQYGRSAGPQRNKQMLDAAGPDGELWWFHDNLGDSRGTANCVSQARKRGMVVRDGRAIG